jgi:hypothetical protein
MSSNPTVRKPGSTPRQHDTDDGPALNLAAAARHFNKSIPQLRYYLQTGFPQPDGSHLKLQSVRRKIPNGDGSGRPEETVLLSDLERVLNRPPDRAEPCSWLPKKPKCFRPHCWRDEDGKKWYTERGALEKYGIPPQNLNDWAESPCRFLGRPVHIRKVDLPGFDEKETVYDGHDLATIQDERTKAGRKKGKAGRKPGKVFEEDGIRYPTRAQFIWLHQDKGAKKSFFMCRRAELEKYSRAVPNPFSTGLREVKGYREDKALELLTRPKRQIPDEEEGKRILRSLLAAGPKVKQEVILEARKRGLSQNPLWRAKKALRVVSESAADGRRFWSLPSDQAAGFGNDETVPDAKPRPTATKPGRPRSPQTAALYESCFRAYTTQPKLALALRMVQREHGQRAPKDIATLRLYAHRHAERYGLPLKRPTR